MLEINVSRLARADGPDAFDFSRSRMEAGINAGPDSWRNAKAEVSERPLIRRRHCAAVRDYFEGLGAWDRAELNRWTWEDCAAIVLQHASGDFRELQACCPGDGPGGIDWAEAQRQAERGRVSGNLYISGNKMYLGLSD